MSWKCDKCGKIFEHEDIPEKCPECNSEVGTFSLVDKKIEKK
jgi:rubrerythrin